MCLIVLGLIFEKHKDPRFVSFKNVMFAKLSKELK